MNYRSAARDIAKGRAKPIYALYGSERYFMQEFIHYAVDQLAGAENKDLALVSYDLSETPIQDVIEDAETLPFMVPVKMITAYNASFLTAAKDNGKVNHKVERLLEYMESPAEYTILMLAVDAEKVDERKKAVKLLKKNDALLPFLPMLPEELQRWVEKQAERHQCRITSDAAEAILLSAGTNVQTLAAEIEKLSLYAGAGGTIETEAVEKLVARSIEQTIFKLVDEIVRVRLDKAFAILSEMVKMREEPVKILWFIARQFRIMLQVKELLKQGFSQQQAASKLGLHPYAVKVAANQAGHYGEKRLLEVLDRLAELDYRMKSGRVDKVLGLEMFLLQLAG